jgi:hypothetical protein
MFEMAVILLGSEPGREKELALCREKEPGVIELNDGKVTGGDTVLAYTGSYVVDGDKFTAFIATERHTAGQPSVFGIGIDDVNLTLTGKSTRRRHHAPELPNKRQA